VINKETALWTGAVIGLGNIGLNYDLQATVANQVISHSKALSVHPDFRLVGAVDPENLARKNFESAYGVKAYDSIANLLENTRPDFLAVSCPTSSLVQVADEILTVYRPKLILIEKPISYTMKGLSLISEIQNTSGVPFVVNFPRAYDPSYLAFANKLKSFADGNFFEGVAIYSGGYFNNASHLFQICENLFGPLESFSKVDLIEFGSEDFSIDLQLHFLAGKILVKSLRDADLSVFTLDVFNSKGRFTVLPGFGGFQITEFISDSRFQNRVVLSDNSYNIPSTMGQSQLNVLDACSSFLKGSLTSLVPFEESLHQLIRLHEVLNFRNG